MTLYEIDKALEALVAESIDPDTGEVILDAERFDALQMERKAKIENTVLLLKNVRAEVEAFRVEETALAARRKAKERFAAQLESLVLYATGGERFETARAAVQFRKTPEKVVITDGCEPQFIEWAQKEHPEFLRVTTQPDKAQIKAALKIGEAVPFASLTSGTSMTIK